MVGESHWSKMTQPENLDWKSLYEEQLEKNQRLQEKLLETEKNLDEKTLKNDELQILLKKYRKYVPKEKLKPKYTIDEEKYLSIIQRSCRRNIQSRNLINLGTFFF